MSVFAHIIDTGSISAAAEHLNISKSVISQHLKTLERELGVCLLKRTTRRQQLTSAGQTFYHQCKALNQIANNAWLEAQQATETPKGTLNITASNALMETLITPVIGELVKLYPLLTPRLVCSDEHVNFFDDNIDLAIRVGSSDDSSLIQQKIGEFHDVLCGNPTLISQNKRETIPYIANAWQGQKIEHHFISKTAASFNFQSKVQCSANSFHSCLSLIKSGAGIGLIPDFYLQNMTDTLQPIFPQHFLTANSVYLLMPFQKNVPLAVQVCIDAIKQQFHHLKQANTASRPTAIE